MDGQSGRFGRIDLGILRDTFLIAATTGLLVSLGLPVIVQRLEPKTETSPPERAVEPASTLLLDREVQRCR